MFTDDSQLNNDPTPAAEDDFDMMPNSAPSSPLRYRSPFEPHPHPPNPFPSSRTEIHPFNDHNPWADVPDPEEGDISTFQFQTPGGGRGTFSFTSRTYTSRATPNSNGARGPPMFPFGSPFGAFQAQGGHGAGQQRPQPGDMQDLFSAIFSTMQNAQLHAQPGQRQAGGFFVGPNAARPPNPFDLLSAMLNPGGHTGRAGDVVWSQQELDRILESLGAEASNAPPPASEEAIRGLPRKKVNKEMLGEDGKAECSICMENVELDSEVTSLPCNHWFHQDCVVAWLKEHDTCPHCRKPITNAENRQESGTSASRRRGSRRSSSVATPYGPGGAQPWQVPDSPSAIRNARNRYYGNRTASERDNARETPQSRPGRRSSSPARSTGPEQYYGGRHESTDYYAGRSEPTRRLSNQSRSSRSETPRSPSGGGGVAGWIRDHLPLGGGGR
jgi:E3 ubiquitin-protein ligase RNF115/126